MRGIVSEAMLFDIGYAVLNRAEVHVLRPGAAGPDVVETLADHPSATATLVACGVPEAQRPAYVKALADLARSQMIERRPEEVRA